MKISNCLAQKLVDENIITSEDRELYEYGLECFILKGIHILSYVLIALSTNMFLEFLLFFLAYYPIRIYAGGYHANTRVGCYLFSCSQVFLAQNVIALVNTFLLNYEVGIYYLLLVALLLALLIALLAPVDSINKILDLEEKILFQGKTYFFLCVEVGIVLVAIIMHLFIVYAAILIGFLCEVFMMVLGKRKNRILGL